MVGLNHQQFKTIFTERFRLSPSSEFTGKFFSQNFNISTGKSRKYKINMKMFLKLLFKFILNVQFQILTGAMKRPPCSNFALLNDHFQFLRSFNVNLNSNLRNIFMFILYFLDLPVEMLKF